MQRDLSPKTFRDVRETDLSSLPLSTEGHFFLGEEGKAKLFIKQKNELEKMTVFFFVFVFCFLFCVFFFSDNLSTSSFWNMKVTFQLEELLCFYSTKPLYNNKEFKQMIRIIPIRKKAQAHTHLTYSLWILTEIVVRDESIGAHFFLSSDGIQASNVRKC